MLGIVIPYYKNSVNCEVSFKKLIKSLLKQLTTNMYLYIYEDGQVSDWLTELNEYDNIYVDFSLINRGVSYARNKGIEFLKYKTEYILFLDSDDMIDGNFLFDILLECRTKKYDIVESLFFVNNELKETEKIRTGVCGSAIKTSVIGDIRFKENLLVGEDTEFMWDLWRGRELTKKTVSVCYFYNLGFNKNSLMMRYLRHEINKENIGGNFRNE